MQIAFQSGSQRVRIASVIEHEDEGGSCRRCHQSREGSIDVCVREQGNLDSSRQLHGVDTLQRTKDGVVVLGLEEGRRVERELFGDARANAGILPQSCALDILTGTTGSTFGAGLLQHATAEAGALLAHSLYFLTSLLGESATHFVLVGALQQTKAALVDSKCW